MQESSKHAQPNYLAVFIALVVLTVVEVGVTYVTALPRIPVLVPLAILKAGLVVLFYMHLRYDRRVFTVIFLLALVGAVLLMSALLALFAPPLLDM